MLTVTLAHRPNPDLSHRGGYWTAPIDSGQPETVHARSLEEAVKLCRAYIDSNQLGGSNWTGGTVRNADGEIVGRIAYNGRFSPPESLDACPTMHEMINEASRLFRSLP